MDLLLLYQGIRKVKQKETEQLLELLDMTDYINSAIGTYSTGMIKKLSLVLAFMGNLPLCVLDEPLITLDDAAYNSVCTFILESHKHTGTTFLMSSHQELDTQLILSGKEISIRHQSIIISNEPLPENIV